MFIYCSELFQNFIVIPIIHVPYSNAIFTESNPYSIQIWFGNIHVLSNIVIQFANIQPTFPLEYHSISLCEDREFWIYSNTVVWEENIIIVQYSFNWLLFLGLFLKCNLIIHIYIKYQPKKYHIHIHLKMVLKKIIHSNISGFRIRIWATPIVQSRVNVIDWRYMDFK